MKTHLTAEEYQTDILQKIHVVPNTKETTNEQKEPKKTDIDYRTTGSYK